MEDNPRKSEEFLPQLANVAEYFIYLPVKLKNVNINLELDDKAYYNSLNEVEKLTKVVSKDIDSRYILYIDSIKFTIIRINK